MLFKYQALAILFFVIVGLQAQEKQSKFKESFLLQLIFHTSLNRKGFKSQKFLLNQSLLINLVKIQS